MQSCPISRRACRGARYYYYSILLAFDPGEIRQSLASDLGKFGKRTLNRAGQAGSAIDIACPGLQRGRGIVAVKQRVGIKTVTKAPNAVVVWYFSRCDVIVLLELRYQNSQDEQITFLGAHDNVFVRGIFQATCDRWVASIRTGKDIRYRDFIRQLRSTRSYGAYSRHGRSLFLIVYSTQSNYDATYSIDDLIIVRRVHTNAVFQHLHPQR